MKIKYLLIALALFPLNSALAISPEIKPPGFADSWVLRVTVRDSARDFYQECNIDNKGRVALEGRDHTIIKKNKIAQFASANTMNDISLAYAGEIKANDNSADNQEHYPDGRAEKDYFARKPGSTESVLLRHEDLKESKQNISSNAKSLITLLDRACGTATHKHFSY